MASASYALTDFAAATVTFYLAGQNQDSALYKDTTRDIRLPLTQSIKFNLGSPAAKGSDHILFTFADAVEDADGVVAVGQVKVDISVPRNSGWSETHTKDLMSYVASFLTGTRIGNLADAMVP